MNKTFSDENIRVLEGIKLTGKKLYRSTGFLYSGGGAALVGQSRGPYRAQELSNM